MPTHRNRTNQHKRSAALISSDRRHNLQNQRDPRHLAWASLVFWGMVGLEKRWLQADGPSNGGLNESANQLLKLANALVTHWR